MSEKQAKTQAEIDDERIARQHKRALMRGSRWGGNARKSHLSYKAHVRDKTRSELLDEAEQLE